LYAFHETSTYFLYFPVDAFGFMRIAAEQVDDANTTTAASARLARNENADLSFMVVFL
jgi:hypothetical protein